MNIADGFIVSYPSKRPQGVFYECAAIANGGLIRQFGPADRKVLRHCVAPFAEQTFVFSAHVYGPVG